MQNTRDEVRRRDALHPPRPSCSAVCLLSLLAATSIGCGTLSYKTGSTAGDYHAAGDRCRKEGRGESPDFERCMQEQGWVVKQLGAPVAPNDAQKSAPAAGPSPSVQPAPAAPSAAGKSLPEESPPPHRQALRPAPSDAPEDATARGALPSQPAPAAPSDAKNGAAAASPPPGFPSAPTDGDVAPAPRLSDAPAAEQPMVVKNWFKFGGTADELAAAQARCATKLGAAGRVDPESDVVTGEMIDCLRSEGWHAF